VREGENGLKVTGRDAGELARAISLLATEPALRARMAAQAVLDAQTYSWPRTVARYEEVYSRLDPALAPASQALLSESEGVWRELIFAWS